MKEIIQKYYSEYMNTLSGFNTFHNEVINMPRDQFSDTGLQKVKTLAGYLLLTEGKLDPLGVNYKDTLLAIHNELALGYYPAIRDDALESRYFNFEDIDSQYAVEGRMFRHLMGLCAFFGFVNSITKQKKIFNYDKCREYYFTNEVLLIPVARNNLILLNAKTNDYINALDGIAITEDTDYQPALAILHYIKDIRRPVTKFEISVLLGRIDKLKNQKQILERALDIGIHLPRTISAQQTEFFKAMSWQNSSGTLFEYAASQQPYFKFNSFILLMEAFELIKINPINELITLTQYAEGILADNISYLIADLEKLLIAVDNYSGDNSQLNDLILYQRNPELLKLAKDDPKFIEKMNWRSLRNPIIIDGKKTRNRLIAELAKIQADYKCQYANRHIFKMPNCKFYCEAHHIIEFSTEQGPDITLNLIVLGPEAHKIVHHACKEDKDNLYMQLAKNGALNISRFKEMITTYHCLKKEQLEILYNKHIITLNEKQELCKLLEA